MTVFFLCSCFSSSAAAARPSSPAWVDRAELHDYDLVPIPTDEPWAANTLPIGSKVLLAAQHPRTADLIQGKGFDIHPLNLSEFAKAEGGPTCLSLLLA